MLVISIVKKGAHLICGPADEVVAVSGDQLYKFKKPSYSQTVGLPVPSLRVGSLSILLRIIIISWALHRSPHAVGIAVILSPQCRWIHLWYQSGF